MPPCIVLGLETQIGLGIARELGCAGIRVIGVAQNPHALGLSSRYLFRSIVVSEPRSEQLIEALKGLGREYGECCLLTVSEANIDWLLEVRDRLGSVKPALPEHAAWRSVLDKSATLKLASEVGIRVPETHVVSSRQDVIELAGFFRFPGVLKWPDPAFILADLERCRIPFVKAEYVNSADEFLTAMSRYDTLGKWPLLQTYCAGRGLGQFFYMSGGQAVRRFQHARVAEWPPEGGFSSVCDAVPLSLHESLQDKSIALLRRIGWQGVAMVEYRFDEVTGEAVLMEINGRFWGSFPLAVHSGAGFALLAYRETCGLPLVALPDQRDDIRCRMAVGEIKRLIRIFFQREKIKDHAFKVRPIAELWRFIADYFRPRVRYYVWDASDPAPFFADMVNAFRKIF